MSTLDDEPVEFIEAKPGEDPSTVVLVFKGKPEGIWKNTWQYIVDKATAVHIQQYCQDRAAKGRPICKEEIEKQFGVSPN
jgi:hypothetical protein